MSLVKKNDLTPADLYRAVDEAQTACGKSLNFWFESLKEMTSDLAVRSFGRQVGRTWQSILDGRSGERSCEHDIITILSFLRFAHPGAI